MNPDLVLSEDEKKVIITSVADPDPFLFDLPDPGSKKLAKITENENSLVYFN